MRLRICALMAAFVCLAVVHTANGVTVSSFSPTFGAWGEQVTIYGSGFYPGTLFVRFNGIQDRTAAAVSDDGTVIAARVPTNATTGPISVSINGGPFSYSAQDFNVIGFGPYVTNFSPYVGGAGTTVFIDGVHFTGATNAYFNGVPGTGFFVQTDNRLQVAAPAGVVSGPISIRSPKGTHVSSNFFVTPVLTGFSPSIGRASTNVTLTGINLLGATAVLFNGISVTPVAATNNNSLVVTAPAGVSTGPIRVNTPAGSSTSSSNFVVRPTIFGYSPGAGGVGTSITLTGANFNVGTPTVRFNGVASTNVSSVSFGQLTAVVPTGATTGPIGVTTTDGSYTNSATFFVPASITSFTPTNSVPGTTVTITGQNFLGVTNVSFNGASASFTLPVTNTTLQAVVPNDVTTGPISVTTPAGTATSSRLFYARPVITDFSPTHGLPETNVTIIGLNFLGATAVRFNGVDASFVPPTNNTTIQAIVPATAQTGPITVVAPAGTNTSASNFVLDYNSDLTVGVSASPSPVFLGSNLVYTISITNFGPLPAPNVYLTNTLPGSVILKSASTSQGTMVINGNPIVGSFGTVAAGGTVTVTLTVVPQTTGAITDVVSVSSGYSDPSPGNNNSSLSTTVLPLPVLSIQLTSPNRVQLSWPLVLTNFVLESRSSLQTGLWSNVNTAPLISGGEKVVTETNSAKSKFYRLRK